MMPLLAERLHPAVRQLKGLLDGGESAAIGKVEQVVMERQLASRTRPVVLAHFARDIDVLRYLYGELTKLGAMGAGSEEAAYAHLGIQLSGEGQAAVRWGVSPVESASGARLSLLGENGKAVLHMPEGERPWSLETSQSGRTSCEEFPDWNPAAAALDQFQQAIRGQVFEPDWVDGARSVELTETIERSLRKARTVELYYEDYTEEGTFKGTMTSLGCGLLLLGLALLVVVALGEQMGIPFLRHWPKLLLAVLAFFLMLQLLKLLFASSNSNKGHETGEGKSQG
jgi:hypothetical protein